MNAFSEAGKDAGRQFDPSMLPPKPNMLTDEVRQKLNPTAPIPREHVAMLLAMLANTLKQQLGNDKRLGKLDVHIDTRPTGFTLTVDMPTPQILEHSDVTIPN